MKKITIKVTKDDIETTELTIGGNAIVKAIKRYFPNAKSIAVTPHTIYIDETMQDLPDGIANRAAEMYLDYVTTEDFSFDLEVE